MNASYRDPYTATLSIGGSVTDAEFSAADAEALARRLVRPDVTVGLASYTVTGEVAGHRMFAADFTLSAS